MGDNRDNSLDSRVQSAVGYVPAENLVGRAEILFFSTDGSAAWYEFWKWPMATRFGRLFTAIR
jgi:signal peptidase I